MDNLWSRNFSRCKLYFYLGVLFASGSRFFHSQYSPKLYRILWIGRNTSVHKFIRKGGTISEQPALLFPSQ